jgi:hypothetical protein
VFGGRGNLDVTYTIVIPNSGNWWDELENVTLKTYFIKQGNKVSSDFLGIGTR